jgi:hypothetical protein
MATTTYVVTRTAHAADLVLGDITIEADSPHVDRGIVRATLSAYNGSLLFRSTANLTSERARRQLLTKLAERGVEIDDGALVALEEGCRRQPPKQEKPVAEPIAPEDIEPGHDILDAIDAFLGRFVAYPSRHARAAHALWVAHTHLMNEWDSTPRLTFLSPEPKSGKTRGLEVTEPLVPNPLHAVNVSPPYLFRRVGDEAKGRATLLFDEADTVFGPKAKEHEDVRGLLNAGHRKGAVTGRCIVTPNGVETVEYPAYCAVALAGLGDLPDTILTRSVNIKMRRRAKGERVEPFRPRLVMPTADALRERLATWAAAIAHRIGDPWPEMPDGIEDRDAEVWEALLAVADVAGGEWPQRAREAAVAFVAESQEDTPSLGIRLLTDLRTVFEGHASMATVALLKALHGLDEAPWAEIARGEPLNALGLSQRLRPYGVKSRNVRIGSQVVKGYKREDFADAWNRYLPPSPQKPATGATTESQTEEETPRQAGLGDGVADVAGVAGFPGEGDGETSPDHAGGRVCVQCGVELPDGWTARYCQQHGGQADEQPGRTCHNCGMQLTGLSFSGRCANCARVFGKGGAS